MSPAMKKNFKKLFKFLYFLFALVGILTSATILAIFIYFPDYEEDIEISSVQSQDGALVATVHKNLNSSELYEYNVMLKNKNQILSYSTRVASLYGPRRSD